MAVVKSVIAQIGIEMGQFLGQHQSLVDNGAAAEAGNVETLDTFRRARG